MTPVSVLGLISIIVTYNQVWYIIGIVSSSPTDFHSEKIGLIRVTNDPPVSIRVNKYLKSLSLFFFSLSLSLSLSFFSKKLKFFKKKFFFQKIFFFISRPTQSLESLYLGEKNRWRAFTWARKGCKDQRGLSLVINPARMSSLQIFFQRQSNGWLC